MSVWPCPVYSCVIDTDRLLVELNVPYMIVLGGTDVNVYGQNEERKKIMINVLTNAKRVIVFDKSMVKACCKVFLVLCCSAHTNNGLFTEHNTNQELLRDSSCCSSV